MFRGLAHGHIHGNTQVVNGPVTRAWGPAWHAARALGCSVWAQREDLQCWGGGAQECASLDPPTSTTYLPLGQVADEVWMQKLEFTGRGFRSKIGLRPIWRRSAQCG